MTSIPCSFEHTIPAVLIRPQTNRGWPKPSWARWTTQFRAAARKSLVNILQVFRWMADIFLWLSHSGSRLLSEPRQRRLPHRSQSRRQCSAKPRPLESSARTKAWIATNPPRTELSKPGQKKQTVWAECLLGNFIPSPTGPPLPPGRASFGSPRRLWPR
jgi:hypothetical protein